MYEWTNVDKKGQKSHPKSHPVFGRYTRLVLHNKLQTETLPSYVVKSTCFFITSLLLYITSLTGLHSEIVDVSFFPAMLMRAQPHFQPNIMGFRPTILWSIPGSVFARPGVDDKPIIPVLSRRIMSV